jgi:hypothetical protein
MAKAPAIPFDGSRPLKNGMHERYARYRAQALPRAVSYRKAGNTMTSDNGIGVNSHRLERRPEVRGRIEFLARQAQERVIEKRQRLEETLWAIHEGNVQDLFEVAERAKTNSAGDVETDENGRMLTVREERPRLISDLAPEVAQLVEDVTIDRKGRFVPRLYSKAQANKELRAMLDIGRVTPEGNDASRLSDAELVAQLSDQANKLGVKIDLSYSFDGEEPNAAIDATATGDGAKPENA